MARRANLIIHDAPVPQANVVNSVMSASGANSFMATLTATLTAAGILPT